jgi:hypothetical protein
VLRALRWQHSRTFVHWARPYPVGRKWQLPPDGPVAIG